MQFTFWVPGQPVAKARARIFRGRAFTPAKTAEYEQHVWESAAPHIPDGWPRDCEYILTVVLRFKGRAHGDGSNVFKAVEDGQNPARFRAGTWFDDKQVRDFHCFREYVGTREEAGALVKVEAVPCPKGVLYLPKPPRESKPRRKATRKRKTPK